jgi:hypothetical protein
MPSVESLSLNGVLGQVLYDVCVPKNVEGWDLTQAFCFKPHAYGCASTWQLQSDEVRAALEIVNFLTGTCENFDRNMW